eukprot:834434-Pyramimonas_sp.AAC.1
MIVVMLMVMMMMMAIMRVMLTSLKGDADDGDNSCDDGGGIRARSNRTIVALFRRARARTCDVGPH